MSITFSNGFGFGASNNGGGGGGPQGNGPAIVNFNAAENNTTGLAFFAVPSNRNNFPGFASGWNNLAYRENRQGQYYEFAYMSYQQFSSPQTNLTVTSQNSVNFNDVSPKGLTVITDALVGDGASPTVDNYLTGENNSTNSISLYFSASAYSVIVVASGVENNQGNVSTITGITGGGLTWTRRSQYVDPLSGVHQKAEIWFAVNNNPSAFEDTIVVTFDNQFDDQATIISSWSNCVLNNPWTTSGASYSNSNTTKPA